MNIERTYMEQAQQLLKAHGKLAKVPCQSDGSITFVYEDGYTWTDSVYMKFGYYGQGPSCFESFLRISGFDISPKEISELRAPVTLVAGQPPPRALVIEALTLEDARRKANESVPPDATVIGLEVVHDGTPQVEELAVEGSSREAASKEARRRLPDGATVQQEQTIREGNKAIVTVQAYSRREADRAAMAQLPEGATTHEVLCREYPKGFLCFGRKPGTYQVSWSLLWRIKLTYRKKAVVKVRFQPSLK